MAQMIKLETWLGWILAVLTCCVSLVGYTYQNFEQKADADKKDASIEKRLDRIEDKLDKVIEADRKQSSR